jgi:hypothetical protein
LIWRSASQPNTKATTTTGKSETNIDASWV